MSPPYRLATSPDVVQRRVPEHARRLSAAARWTPPLVETVDRLHAFLPCCAFFTRPLSDSCAEHKSMKALEHGSNAFIVPARGVYSAGGMAGPAVLAS